MDHSQLNKPVSDCTTIPSMENNNAAKLTQITLK